MSFSKIGPSQRILKVGEEVRRILAGIFQENTFWDGRLRSLSMTVTEVRMSPDLKHARIYILPLNFHISDSINSQSYKKEMAKIVLEGLAKEANRIRKLLGFQAGLRVVPALQFIMDFSFDKAKSVDDLLTNPRVLKDIQSATDLD